MKNSTMNIAAIIANPSIVDQKTFNFEEINANKATLSRRFDMMMAKIKFLVKQNLIDTENLSTVFNNVTGTIKGTFDEMDVIKDDKVIGGFCFQNGGFVEGGESYFWTTNKDETRNVTFFTNCNEMKKQLKENAEMIELIRATFNPDYVEPVVEEKPAKVKKEKTVKKAKFVEVDDLDADIPAKRTRKKETKVEEIATVDNVEEIEVIA